MTFHYHVEGRQIISLITRFKDVKQASKQVQEGWSQTRTNVVNLKHFSMAKQTDVLLSLKKCHTPAEI